MANINWLTVINTSVKTCLLGVQRLKKIGLLLAKAQQIVECCLWQSISAREFTRLQLGQMTFPGHAIEW